MSSNLVRNMDMIKQSEKVDWRDVWFGKQWLACDWTELMISSHALSEWLALNRRNEGLAHSNRVITVTTTGEWFEMARDDDLSTLTCSLASNAESATA